MTEFWLSVGFGLVTASMIALGAVGITLQFGITNYANFAYGEFLTLGAYIAWELVNHYHWSVWVAMAPAALAVGLLAIIAEKFLLGPFFRKLPRPFYMVVVTFGLSLILINGISLVWNIDPRSFLTSQSGVSHVGPFLFTTAQIVIIALAAVVMLLLSGFLKYTRIGKAMRAVSDDQDLASASGVSTGFVRSTAFFISGSLAGLTGCVLAVNNSVLTPSTGGSFVWLLFAAVIVGGIGQPLGALIGAVVIGLVTEVSAVWINPAYKTDIAFLILAAMLLLRPQGIFATRGRH